ncbi:MAG TPA: sigma-70 family RNA polymerase sigma factor [Chitinophagaceae bacterium]|nr:sigma-70 family RNA polymerase sigma factor [Chitinophagaceae bacterium]
MSNNPANTERLSAWWQLACEGDTQAFEKIHRELFAALYYYALKLLEDNELADDAVQDLFIKIWVKRAEIGELQKVKAYFFTALRRQVLNQLRNLRLRQLNISRLLQPEIEFSPEEIVVHQEEADSLHARLLQLLNELPPRQREAIYLHYFENMDYQQVAAIMGVNYQSVLNLVQKAMQKLRSANLLWLLVFITRLTNAK